MKVGTAVGIAVGTRDLEGLLDGGEVDGLKEGESELRLGRAVMVGLMVGDEEGFCVTVGAFVGCDDGALLGETVELGTVVGDGDGAGLSDGEAVGDSSCNPLSPSAATRGNSIHKDFENFIVRCFPTHR